MSKLDKEGEQFVPEAIANPRNMSRLAIVRHGDDGYDGRLNDIGRRQMQALGEKLAESFDQDSEMALVLSSTAPRAVDSAEILAGLLQAPIEKHEVLWSGGIHPEDLEAVYKLVRSMRTRADLLVVVTHFEYAEEFPGFLGQRDLNQPYRESFGKGEGVVLDYRKRCITRI